MTNFKCEDLSLCENFQAAICLHCNQRLCVRHIIEHDQIVFDDVKNVLNLTENAFQEIKDNFEKSRIVCDNLLPSVDDWRKQNLEKIEQIYENELLLIKNEGEALEEYHRDLLEQLERDTRQPLERVLKQNNVNTETLNHIRQTIKNIREECTDLKWEYPVPSPINAEYSFSDFSPIPMADIVYDKKEQHSSSSSLNLSDKSNQKQSNTTKKTASRVFSISKPVKISNGTPRKKLVRMFSNISSIEQGKADIAAYKGGRKLIVLVNSYLTAWNRQSNVLQKAYLLNGHISTIQKYFVNRESDFDVLVGIQAFFHNNSVQGQKSDIMSFLLQFFLDHQCLTQKAILDWYNSNHSHGYMGYEKAKQLVEPFIQSISTLSTNERWE